MMADGVTHVEMPPGEVRAYKARTTRYEHPHRRPSAFLE